jgi:putative nucleotidyltransferase with HDIG domain
VFSQRPDRAVPFTRRELVRLTVAALLLIVTLTGILAVDVAPASLGLQAGHPAQESIRAPRAITYVSEINTKRAQDQAAEGVPPQYDYSAERAANIAAQQGAAFTAEVTDADAAFNSTTLDAINRADLLRSTLPGLSDGARETLTTLSPTEWRVIRAEATRVLNEMEQTELRDTDLTTQRQLLGSRVEAGLSSDERELVVELISPLVVANSSYSETLTQQKQAQASASVQPVTQSYQQGEVIVDQGHLITAVDLEAIDALGLNESHVDTAQLAGWLLLSILTVGLLLAWVWRFRPELWHRNNVLVLVGLMLVLATVALKVTAGREILPFFVPTAAVGMLLAILLDAGAATVLIAVLAVLAGAINGSSLELASYVFLGGLAGIVGVRRGDRLHVFVQAGLAVALVNMAVVSTFVLLGERDLDLTGLLQLWAAAATSGAGAAVVTIGSFAALGNLFGILTVFQLLELANPSQAVLRRLLTETPGTYHHSLMVGNLAERAAESVGADPLLARTAAYYHDIGKLNNPLAFIENQAGGDNVHDELPPEVSAQILKAHVADGIDVAYRSRLPKALISFIPQHHGTALMSYFYAKAKEEAAAPFGGTGTTEGAKAADAVDARRFRHAGPKPQSREAAILMLADSVEASVRSLSSRDEATIRAMVTRIIDERLKDGQFDECDLTLRDIEKIREAFVSQLLGMYHQRIAYPQNKVVELESRRGAGTGA